MANIGFTPTATSISVREPDGDAGTIPGATERAAGVMTARHVQMLEAVHQWYLTAGAGSAPVIIERAPDTSAFLTKADAQQLLARLKPVDIVPEVRQLRSEIETLKSVPPAVLSAPEPGTESEVITMMIEGMEALDRRVSFVERILRELRLVADQAKAA